MGIVLGAINVKHGHWLTLFNHQYVSTPLLLMHTILQEYIILQTCIVEIMVLNDGHSNYHDDGNDNDECCTAREAAVHISHRGRISIRLTASDWNHNALQHLTS